MSVLMRSAVRLHSPELCSPTAATLLTVGTNVAGDAGEEAAVACGQIELPSGFREIHLAVISLFLSVS